MVSNGVRFVSSFVKIGEMVQHLKWGRNRDQHGDIVRQFVSFLKKKRKLKQAWHQWCVPFLIYKERSGRRLAVVCNGDLAASVPIAQPWQRQTPRPHCGSDPMLNYRYPRLSIIMLVRLQACVQAWATANNIAWQHVVCRQMHGGDYLADLTQAPIT
jgi:hypothetical protein